MNLNKFLIATFVTFGFISSLVLLATSKASHFLPGLTLNAIFLCSIFYKSKNNLKKIRLTKPSLGSLFKKTNTIIRSNFLVFLLISIYVSLGMVSLTWGSPNISHPFPYHMDEWHQLQSLRSLYENGSNNVDGAAYGTFLNYILAGFYVAFFTLLGIINPQAISSSVDNLSSQTLIFGILRMSVLLYGIGALTIFSYICKKYFSVDNRIGVFLFISVPVFLIISNYFKYDITLIFFILLAFLFTLRFGEKPNMESYILMCISCTASFSIKMSSIALLPLPFIALALYISDNKERIRYVLIGLGVIAATTVTVGMPDIFSKITEYKLLLSSNTDSIYKFNELYKLKEPFALYAVLRMFPTLFGYGLFILSIVSIPAVLILSIKNSKLRKKIVILVAILVLFAITLLQLKWHMGGNRSLVLVPFLIISSLLFLKHFVKNKSIYLLLTVFLVVMQTVQIIGFLQIKFDKPIQERASTVINSKIGRGSTIGLENIPIYQLLPDLIVKEFYFNQYKMGDKNKYKYKIITENDESFPRYVILSNAYIAQNHFNFSSKENIAKKLHNLGYGKFFEVKTNLHIFSLFGDEFDYYFSGLLAMPYDITVYEKK